MSGYCALGEGKVLRIVHVMASSEVGGGAKYLELVLPELRSLGIELSVITSPGGPMVERLRESGFDVTTPVNMMRRRFSPRVSVSLYRAFGACRPDLIHFHGTRAAFQGSALPLRCPTIYTSHGAGNLPMQSRFRRMMMSMIERQNALRVSRYTGVSRRDVLAVLGRQDTSAYVPNPVDPRFVATDPIRFLKPMASKEPLVIGTVGRLVTQKGIETLIDALAHLRGRPVELQIAGDGPLRSALEQQARQQGVKVTFFGTVPDPLPILKKFDIFVIPSRWEGQPLSLLEALAVGIPVIASACPGLVEVAAELGLTRLFPVEDSKRLAELIDEVIRANPQDLETEVNRLISLMRERTPDRTAERWLEIYRELLG